MVTDFFWQIILLDPVTITNFLQYLDNSYVTDNFELDLYRQAVLKDGPLSYNQCFGFVPLLALGAFKDVEHMDKLKTLEHIYLMYQLTGGVMDD